MNMHDSLHLIFINPVGSVCAALLFTQSYLTDMCVYVYIYSTREFMLRLLPSELHRACNPLPL